MTDDDPNEAYEVVPIEPGPPKGWWTVKRNGLPVRHFPGKENAQRYATDPEYRIAMRLRERIHAMRHRRRRLPLRDRLRRRRRLVELGLLKAKK
jgi:hypothetical protein